jgi:chaperonin cofactor prefoldin
MGCTSTKQFEEYKIDTDRRIAALEKKNADLETELQSTVSNLNDNWDRKFSSFKTSMAITRNMRNQRVTTLGDRVKDLEMRLQRMQRGSQ